MSSFDRAMVAAEEYRRLVDLGQVVRRSIEDLVGAYRDGRFVLPVPVRERMGAGRGEER